MMSLQIFIIRLCLKKDTYRRKARSDTGIEIDLLQKYVFVSLDNFRKRSHNEIIKNEL